jgi:hypothetical protein
MNHTEVLKLNTVGKLGSDGYRVVGAQVRPSNPKTPYSPYTLTPYAPHHPYPLTSDPQATTTTQASLDPSVESRP